MTFLPKFDYVTDSVDCNVHKTFDPIIEDSIKAGNENE